MFALHLRKKWSLCLPATSLNLQECGPQQGGFDGYIFDVYNFLICSWGDVKDSHIIYAAIISMQSGKNHGKPTQVLRRTKIKPGSVSGRTTPIPVQVKFMKILLLKKIKLKVEILN